VGNQHAELRAPVAQMIDADHIVLQELQQAAYRFANDRGSQVTHMHLLGNVGRGEIDQYALLDHFWRFNTITQ